MTRANDATRANAEAMPEAQSQEAVSELLLRTMKRHDAAFAYFESAAYLSDSLELCRQPTETEMEIHSVACKIADNALADVCSFPSTRPADVAAKSLHLLKYHGWLRGDLTDEHIEAFLKSLSSTGERVVGNDLSEMLAAHAGATTDINRHKGDANDPEVVALCERQCELALAICGHRPTTKADARRKAKFLRKWTECTELTAEEQAALIGSLMPEGGAS